MIRLTPELFLHSAFDGDSDGAESRELDFNLARRTGVVINRIIGQVNCDPDTTTGFDVLRAICQEVDLDPDNTEIEFAGLMEPDAVVMDSSRVFRQMQHGNWDSAAGATEPLAHNLIKDWHNLPLQERPISITNLRHHVEAVGTISCNYHAEVAIDYVIVELTLEELGILNASRR